MSPNGGDGGGKVIDGNSEMRTVHRWVARREKVELLPVAELKPRARFRRDVRARDRRKANHISIEGVRLIGVADDECDMVQVCSFRHALIMPDRERSCLDVKAIVLGACVRLRTARTADLALFVVGVSVTTA